MSELKKSSQSWSMWALLLVGLVAALGVFLFIRNRKKQQETENSDQDVTEVPDKDEDEDEIILVNYKIISQGLEIEGIEDETMHRLITAQAMHETAIFDSPVFEKNKNYFGMGHPSKRPTTSTGKVGGYANYETLVDSAKDYALYYKYVGLPNFTDAKTFAAELKKKDYYTDSFVNYSAGVSAHFKKLNQLLNVG